MKKLAVLLLLSSVAGADPSRGFSPTMPFGIPSHTTQAPANSGVGGPCPGSGFSDFYYRNAWGGGFSGYGAPSTVGGNPPGYTHSSKAQQAPPGYYSKPGDQTLPGYNSQARRSQTLPGY